MFSEKLNQLMAALKTNNSELARYAGFDRTNISRMRSGARVPKPGGVSAQKLMRGLWALAEAREARKALAALTGHQSGGAVTQAALCDWLFAGEEAPPSPRTARPRRGRGTIFSEKLDAAMALAGWSNAQLSRRLNVDASLISRFRSGERSPKANPELAGRLSHLLYERVAVLGRQGALARLMGADERLADEAAFSRWLCDFEPFEADWAAAAGQLLAAFDGDLSRAGEEPAPPDVPVPPAEGAQPAVYIGTAGIRAAVLRFLTAALSCKAKMLWLYSDQPMDWLVADSAFHAKWAALMRACVKGGMRIRMIHSIGRGLGEMQAAIRSWLPLYMSGMMEPYYSTHSGRGAFSHTLFLCPGVAAVTACHVAGCEATGLYHYHEAASSLAAAEAAYRGLLAQAKPLMRIGGAAWSMPESGATVIQSGPSLATMPEALAESFESEALMAAWRMQQKHYAHWLQAGYICEYWPRPSDKAVAAGQMRVAVPGESLCYTPLQYEAHLRHVKALSEAHANYYVYLLPDWPLRRVTLVIGSDTTLVMRQSLPLVTFQLKHPAMCRAFQAYAYQLEAQAQPFRS